MLEDVLATGAGIDSDFMVIFPLLDFNSNGGWMANDVSKRSSLGSRSAAELGGIRVVDNLSERLHA